MPEVDYGALTADSGFSARVKALACTAPLHGLDERKAAIQTADYAVYQMAELALTAIDLVTLSMDFDRGARPTDVLASLATAARAQTPDRDQAEHDAVAAWVVNNLLNVGNADRGLAYPRPADLGNPAYVGRVTVNGVDAFVREAARRLDEQAVERGEDTDPPADRPDLEAAWRAYRRRAGNPSSLDGRRVWSSTVGMVGKALTFLADQGLLIRAGDENGGTYRTTSRYRVQVLEAGARMFDELVRLDVATVSDGHGSLDVTPITWTADDVAEL